MVCTAGIGDLFSAGDLDTLIPCGEKKVILLAASSWTDTIFKTEAISQCKFCELRVAEFAGTLVVPLKTRCKIGTSEPKHRHMSD